jgi:uncharacterized protein (DUF1501 family)
MASRREFLKRCCTFGAAGAAAHLSRFGLMTAQAQSPGDYKALVCIFLFGGNDNNNTVAPTGAGYQAYATMRGGLAIPQAQLLPVGSVYGLHPRLLNLKALYDQGKAAMMLNVGTLVQPTTKQLIQSRQVMLPKNLYSHSDQTTQWQTSNPLAAGGTGWGGRVNDVVAPGTQFPPGVSVSGNSGLLAGATAGSVTMSPGSNFGLSSFGNQTAMNARFAALQQILTFDSGVQLIASSSGVLTNALRAAQEINAALNSGPPLQTVFPNTGMGRQLQQVARVIQVRNALGMTRQIFFAGMGGFDSHSNLIADQDRLFQQLDGAIGPFQTALAELGAEPNVITFTESEFGRTGNASATDGSDHAWGAHHFMFGGPVRGGAAYGTFPNLQLGGSDDAGNRGLWIPTTGLDQFAGTMASWFGVPDAQLTTTVFPNLANWPAAQRKLAFI